MSSENCAPNLFQAALSPTWSLHSCTDQYSKIWGGRYSKLFCVALSCLVFFHENFSYSHTLPTPFAQLCETMRPLMSSLFLNCNSQTLSRQEFGSIITLFMFSISDITILCCLICNIWKLLCILSHSFISNNCANPVPVIPSWLKKEDLYTR